MDRQKELTKYVESMCDEVWKELEFSYNNSYQASVEMAPFEALYGWQCRTTLFWSQIGDSQLFGLDVLKDAEEQVQMIRENLKIA
jgi:hypothetical protein